MKGIKVNSSNPITVGELIQHLSNANPNDPVKIVAVPADDNADICKECECNYDDLSISSEDDAVLRETPGLNCIEGGPVLPNLYPNQIQDDGYFIDKMTGIYKRTLTEMVNYMNFKSAMVMMPLVIKVDNALEDKSC